MSNLLKPAPEWAVVAIKAICQQVCSQILGIRDYAMGEGRATCSEMKPLRTGMPGGVGAGGETPPATRLGKKVECPPFHFKSVDRIVPLLRSRHNRESNAKKEAQRVSHCIAQFTKDFQKALNKRFNLFLSFAEIRRSLISCVFLGIMQQRRVVRN